MVQVSEHVGVLHDAVPELHGRLFFVRDFLQEGTVYVFDIEVDFGSVVLELVHGVAISHAGEVCVVITVKLFRQVGLVKFLQVVHC